MNLLILKSTATLLPTRYVLTILWDLSNEVLHEVLPQGASEIQAVKLLVIQVYLIKKAFFNTFDFDML